MNFISKLTKKPSKPNVRAAKKRGKRQDNEEEYIEVDLEVEEEERPPVPLFIGNLGGSNTTDAVEFDDEFFDGTVEDDLELGEEAHVFYDKQKNNSFHQSRSHNGSFRQQPVVASELPQYSNYPPQQSVLADAVPVFTGNSGFQPPQIMASSGYISAQHADSPIAQHSPKGMFFPPTMAPVPVATPIFVPGLVGPTPPVPNYNYLGFSELELLEFHQLIANGIPELDAVRSIQYNRLIHHHPAYVPQQMPLSRTSSGIPPVHHSIAANDEDHVYQMILRESIEEEQRRQARLRAAGHSADDLTPDEMMTIAIQQSQDEYERKKRSENQSYGSPSSINGNHSGGVYTSRNSIPKAVSKSSSKAMNSIEKANEDALRQAILLSMQETNVTPSSNSNKRTPAGKMNPSFSYNNNSPMLTPRNTMDYPPSVGRNLSAFTKSGSSDHQNEYSDYGLTPEQQQYQPPSPHFSSSYGVDPSTSHHRPHHSEFFSSRGNLLSGNGTPAVQNIQHGGLRDPTAAQMILARRNLSHSFHSGEVAGSRNDDQDQTRNQHQFSSASSIDPGSTDD